MSRMAGLSARRVAAGVGMAAVVAMAGIGAACGGQSAGAPPPMPQETSIISSVWSSITSWVETEYSTVSSTVTTYLNRCEAVVEKVKDKFETRTPTCVIGVRG